MKKYSEMSLNELIYAYRSAMVRGINIGELATELEVKVGTLNVRLINVRKELAKQPNWNLEKAKQLLPSLSRRPRTTGSRIDSTMLSEFESMLCPVPVVPVVPVPVVPVDIVETLLNEGNSLAEIESAVATLKTAKAKRK